MTLHPRTGIIGCGVLFLLMAATLQYSRLTTNLDVGDWRFTLHAGWAYGFAAAGVLTLLWAAFPKSRVLYLASILAAVVAIWSRALVIVYETQNWVGLLAWLLNVWLLIQVWPRLWFALREEANGTE
jgi:hypothetical protein